MKTFILLLGGLLLSGLAATAQQPFTGYYINNKGDTTAVSFPGYKQWNNNPAQINAQTTGGQPVVLTPGNAREVSIEGYDTYRSRRFTRLVNPTSSMPNYINLPATDSVEEVHGFLLFLTQAMDISLYKYSDKKRINFFIEKEGSLVELKHKIYLKDNSQALDDNTFRQQLSVAFELDPTAHSTLNTKLERLEYHEDQLTSFVRRLGGQTAKKKKMYLTEIALMGGVSVNSFDVKWWDYKSPSSEANYSTSLGPVVGIAVYEYSQRGFGRNFITFQLKYYNYKNKGTYNTIDQQGEVTFRSSIVNLGVGVGRNFIRKHGLSAYAAVLPHGLYLPNSKEEYTTRKAPGTESIFSYNLELQAGVRFPGGIGMWAHYNLLPTDTRDNPSFDHYHRSFQVGLDFLIKRKK